MSRKLKVYEVNIFFPETEAEMQSLRKRIEEAYNNLFKKKLNFLSKYEEKKKSLNVEQNMVTHRNKEIL